MAQAKTAAPKAVKEPSPEEVEVSKEELEQRRVEITGYYKDNIKHLKIQLEYENLLKDIEETRAQRVRAQMFLAQAMAPPDEKAQGQAAQDFQNAQAGADFDADQVPKRTLKRTE